jgi:competence protein ComEC
VLVVPHHGSRRSAGAGLLDRCDPEVALIPAGHLNRYHHPHHEVLERLELRGIPYRYPKRDGRCGARFVDGRWVLYP